MPAAYPAVHSSPLVRQEFVANLSLLYSVRGSNPGLTPYLLASHLDVVPADPAQWDAPPFSAQLIDGFIYARGTIDDKHGVMVRPPNGGCRVETSAYARV